MSCPLSLGLINTKSDITPDKHRFVYMLVGACSDHILNKGVKITLLW